MIIHIAGASGCGKSTLYYKINNIKNASIYELDRLFYGYVDTVKDEKEFENIKENFEEYIQKIIKNSNTKNIIFIGINSFIRAVLYKNKYVKINYRGFYNIPADKKYYLYLETGEILKRKFSREINKLNKIQNTLLENFVKDPIGTQEKINYKVNLLEWKVETENWNNGYKKLGYVFLNSDEIYKLIIKLR